MIIYFCTYHVAQIILTNRITDKKALLVLIIITKICFERSVQPLKKCYVIKALTDMTVYGIKYH